MYGISPGTNKWGEHPIGTTKGPNYSEDVKQNKYTQDRNQKPVSPPQPAAAVELKKEETAFSPSADEVARRAYFCYVNEGSLPGHDVQHWLKAEAQLLAERNLTRVHGFHNQT